MKKILLPLALMTLIAVIVSSCLKDRSQPTATNVVPPPVNTNGDTLIYYWNFNVDSNDVLTPTFASSLTGALPSLTYANGTLYPYDTVQPGSKINAVGADTVLDSSSAALRLRNPAPSPFIMKLPTTGYKNIVLQYVEDHTTKGATVNTISYSVNNGVSWKNSIFNTPTSSPTYNVDSVDTNNGFQLIGWDFSSDDSVNNNPNFQVMITFGTGSTNTSGNDRFDNITLSGKRL